MPTYFCFLRKPSCHVVDSWRHQSLFLEGIPLQVFPNATFPVILGEVSSCYLLPWDEVNVVLSGILWCLQITECMSLVLVVYKVIFRLEKMVVLWRPHYRPVTSVAQSTRVSWCSSDSCHSDCRTLPWTLLFTLFICVREAWVNRVCCIYCLFCCW